MLNTQLPRMPVAFLAHGTPMNALDDNRFTQSWQTLIAGVRPSAILMISAHWETEGCFVTAQKQLPTIHDFGGFPQALFDMQYPASGSVELQQWLTALPGFDIRSSENWGLDHGSWSLLCHLFPNADVPVVQLSLNQRWDTDQHWQLAEALAPLRDAGVLVIGSGNIVHNIQRWMRDPHGPFDYARDFDAAAWDALRHDRKQLLNWRSFKGAADAVPTPEHWWPLIYIAAMADNDDALTSTRFGYQSLEDCSMRSIAFHPPAFHLEQSN